MPMTIPPWIRPASPEFYMQGFSQGEGIAERQNRAEAAIQEMTMRRQAQDQANQLHAVQLATSLQDFALRKQVADEKAREAAMKWQGQQKYQSVLDAGGSPQEAFSASAHLLMPGQLWHIPAMAQSQANAEANRALREREVKVMEGGLKLRETKPPTNTALHGQLTSANSEVRSLRAKLASTDDEAQQKILMSLIEDAEARRAEIERQLQAAGEMIAPSARSKLEMVPEVRTVNPIRSFTERLLPVGLGGVPKTTTTTNMVPRLMPTVGSPAGPSPDAGIVLKENEVIRRTKDGQKAVFDKNTKAFIRYAD